MIQFDRCFSWPLSFGTGSKMVNLATVCSKPSYMHITVQKSFMLPFLCQFAMLIQDVTAGDRLADNILQCRPHWLIKKLEARHTISSVSLEHGRELRECAISRLCAGAGRCARRIDRTRPPCRVGGSAPGRRRRPPLPACLPPPLETLWSGSSDSTPESTTYAIPGINTAVSAMSVASTIFLAPPGASSSTLLMIRGKKRETFKKSWTMRTWFGSRTHDSRGMTWWDIHQIPGAFFRKWDFKKINDEHYLYNI